MQISKKSEYGLRAMAHLAKKYKSGGHSTLKEISIIEEIPFDFLEKIFFDLQKAKLLIAKKGPGGGYKISKNPDRITAKDIIKPLERTSELAGCKLCQKASCCVSKSVWKKIEASLDKTLKSIKLSHLLK